MSFLTKNPQGANNMNIEAGSLSKAGYNAAEAAKNKAAANNMRTETGSFSAPAGNSPQIDAKNLTIIEDQLKREALAYKKCSVYSNYFQDPALKNIANTAAQHHKQHFDALQNYLNSHR